MKKRYVFLLLLALVAGAARAQTYPPPLSDPLQEARDAVSPLSTSRVTTGVLMNRVMTLTNPHRFGGQGDTATDWKGWMQQYWEFYNASLSNAGLPTPATVRANASAKIMQGVVPLLVLSYRYNELLPDAAAQGLITVDSVNERLLDGPNQSRTPYAERSFFSVAMAESRVGATTTVYVGPEFWQGNAPVPSMLWLNFSDGVGWRQVAMGSTVQVQVSGAAQTVSAYTALAGYAATSVRPSGPVVANRGASTSPDLALGLLASRAWPGFMPNGQYSNQRGNAKAIAWIKIRGR